MTGSQIDKYELKPQTSRPHMPLNYGVPAGMAGTLPWSHAVERLERATNYWLATTRPDGRPHVTPVWGAWVDGALYFDGLPTTRWGRNIATDPHVVVHLESGDDVVIVEGVVEDVTPDTDVAGRIVAEYTTKYDYPIPKPAEHGIFCLRPSTARAWTSRHLRESDENWADATRWDFNDDRRRSTL